jgi:S1-C subfamily serine protease
MSIMSSIINNYWIYTTVLIRNEWNETGTGFIVSDKERRKIYLVTNKHVINHKYVQLTSLQHCK